MEDDRIKYLINRYYKGLSTEEEEFELKDLLSKDESSSYDSEKAIFGYYRSCENIPEPSIDFEQKIKAAVDKASGETLSVPATSEEEAKVIPIETASDPLTKVLWINIAALFFVVIGTYMFFTNYHKEPKDTFDDPMIAYVETMKILQEVSEQINKGAKPLAEIGKLNATAELSLNILTNSSAILNENTSVTNK